MSSGVARDRKKRRQERRERRGTYSCEEVQAISLEQISSRHRNNATTIEIPPSIEVHQNDSSTVKMFSE